MRVVHVILRPSTASYNAYTNRIHQPHTHHHAFFPLFLIQLPHTRDWDQIADRIEGRNGTGCRDHFISSLLPNLKRADWSFEEDMCLALSIKSYDEQKLIYTIRTEYSVVLSVARNMCTH